MIEIRHNETGEVLYRTAAGTLEGARLTRARLRCADLRGGAGRVSRLSAAWSCWPMA